MENGNNTCQLELPNPSNLTFPPHRRRPLKSNTYHTFLRLLSLSRQPSFSSPRQGYNDGVKDCKSQDFCFKEADHVLVDKSVDDSRKEGDSFSNGQKNHEDTAVYKNNWKEGNEKFGQERVVIVVDENKGSNQLSERVHEPINAHCVAELCDSKDVSPLRGLKGDEALSVGEVCEAIESSLPMDPVPGLTRRGECDEKVDVVEGNAPEELEQELKCRDMELEKLISTSVDMDASPCVGGFEEIEEGEISGDDELYARSVDSILEDDMLSAKNNSEMVQASKNNLDKDEFIDEVGQNEIGKSNSSMGGGNDTFEVEGESSKKDRSRISDIASGKELETSKAHSQCTVSHENSRNMGQTGRINKPVQLVTSLRYLVPGGNTHSQYVAENQSSATAEEDDRDGQKKRKKEKRARRKKKERIKRAEKNRKLGVKRLKLQPVMKPKPVIYCKHFLRGRCQGGEKCKFSHDTIPLTKSMPCKHFARRSCLKADDCPFDHQLSKYPCNNYASNGFCSRGADCLFSHEVLAKEAPSMTRNASELGWKSLSVPPSLNPKRQENIHGNNHQKVDAKSCSTGLPILGSVRQGAAVPVNIHSTQAPKGVNLFVNGNLSAGATVKQHTVQILKTDGRDVRPREEKVKPLEDNMQKVNEVTERTAARTPKGINFLSFGKSKSFPTGDSSGKVVSKFPANKNSGTGKTTSDDLGRADQITTAPKRENLVKLDSPSGGTASPPFAPRGINFISAGNSSFDSSISAGQPNSHPSVGRTASTSSVDGIHAPEDKSQHPNVMPYRSTAGSEVEIASLLKTSFLAHAPTGVHKALQSTLAFAANMESQVKLDTSANSSFFGINFNKKTESLQSKPGAGSGSSVLDFLSGGG